MRFRPAIFIWFVFAQFLFKFHKNGDNRKLKAWSLDYERMISVDEYNERARALLSSITFFYTTCIKQRAFTNELLIL